MRQEVIKHIEDTEKLVADLEKTNTSKELYQEGKKPGKSKSKKWEYMTATIANWKEKDFELTASTEESNIGRKESVGVVEKDIQDLATALLWPKAGSKAAEILIS